jgi:hypothetical protein
LFGDLLSLDMSEKTLDVSNIKTFRSRGVAFTKASLETFFAQYGVEGASLSCQGTIPVFSDFSFNEIVGFASAFWENDTFFVEVTLAYATPWRLQIETGDVFASPAMRARYPEATSKCIVDVEAFVLTQAKFRDETELPLRLLIA